MTAPAPSPLTPPPSLVNITNPLSPEWTGYYLFGFETFPVGHVPLFNVLQRSLTGPHDDFILGVLSVLLIALISEIVQTILLRTRHRRVGRKGFYAAFILDEAHHLRNLFSFFRAAHRRNERSFGRMLSGTLLITMLGVGLLAAEVLVVFLTQPITWHNEGVRYNLAGVQPAATSLEVGMHVDRLTRRRRCVTPGMVGSSQVREFILNACVMHEVDGELTRNNDVATEVRVASWYHEGGSDHRVEYRNDRGELGTQVVRMRAAVMGRGSGDTYAVRFRNRDDQDWSAARYLQGYMMGAAWSWSCEQGGSACGEDGDDLQVRAVRGLWKRVELWETIEERGGLNESVPVTREVEGIETIFAMRLSRPFRAVERTMHVFVTSSVIEEVEGNVGMYVDAQGVKRDHVPGLLSEEGRFTGVLSLIIVFFALLILLITLRMCLKPVSLAQIAKNGLNDDGNQAGFLVNQDTKSSNVQIDTSSTHDSVPKMPTNGAKTDKEGKVANDQFSEHSSRPSVDSVITFCDDVSR
eukprot:GFKZ01015088.1.p1 GENE.GFKZ01015088.1~~GFKZ01015088.1.p1  ORF type:complete len:524 (+),score=47.51 GFKZ01015088.1:168-1739(+)